MLTRAGAYRPPLGPPLGGILVEGVSWRSLFLINVPLVIAAVWLTSRYMDESRDETATGREWRTAPLIGLRFQRGFLHDGRAATVEEAIRQHAGPGSQASDAVARFEALGDADRRALLEFVEAL